MNDIITLSVVLVAIITIVETVLIFVDKNWEKIFKDEEK